MTIYRNDAYTITHNPESAARWLEAYRFPHQRPLRRDKLKEYATYMEAGKWLPTSTLKIATLPDGTTYLIDGQHRLRAVVDTGKECVFQVEAYCVDTMQEAGEFYYRTDRNGTRGHAEVYRVENIHARYGLSDERVRALAGAVVFIKSNWLFVGQGSKMGVTDDERLQLIREYGDAATLYFACVDNCLYANRKLFLRSPVVALGLATWKYAAEKLGSDVVEGFWTGAAADDGLLQNDPRKVMLEHLRGTKMPTARLSSSATSVTQAYQARYVAQCWNKWATGETFNGTVRRGSARVPNEKAPIVIYGTPWN